MTPPTKAEARYMGTRVIIVTVCVACYFATLYVLATEPTLDQEQTWDSFQWLIGFLGTAVLSVTARPSDAATSPFMKQNPSTDDELGAPL